MTGEETLFDAILDRLAPSALKALKLLAAPHWVPPQAVFLELRHEVLTELPPLIEAGLVRVSRAGHLFVADSLRDRLRARSTPDEVEEAAARLGPLFRGRGDAESQIEAYYHQLFVDPLGASQAIFRSILEWSSEPLFAHHLVQRLWAVWREAHRQRPLPAAAQAYLTFVKAMRQKPDPDNDVALLGGLDPGEDRLLAGHILLRRGSALTLLNRLDEAQSCLATADAHFGALGDRVGLSHAQRLLGRIAAKRDAYATATSLFRRALDLARSADRKTAAAQALQGLADVASLRGDFSEAAVHYEQAIEALSGIGGRTAEANTRNAYSQVLTAIGDLGRAREHVRLAAEAFERLESPLGLANSWRATAQIDIEEGDLTAAEAGLEKASAAYERLGLSTSQAVCSELKGQIHHIRGELERAGDEYRKARETFERIDDGFGAATCVRDLGALAIERGELRQAGELLGQASNRFAQMGASAECAAATLLHWLVDDGLDPNSAAETLERAGAVIPRVYLRVWEESPRTEGRTMGWRPPYGVH